MAVGPVRFLTSRSPSTARKTAGSDSVPYTKRLKGLGITGPRLSEGAFPISSIFYLPFPAAQIGVNGISEQPVAGDAEGDADLPAGKQVWRFGGTLTGGTVFFRRWLISARVKMRGWWTSPSRCR